MRGRACGPASEPFDERSEARRERESAAGPSEATWARAEARPDSAESYESERGWGPASTEK